MNVTVEPVPPSSGYLEQNDRVMWIEGKDVTTGTVHESRGASVRVVPDGTEPEEQWFHAESSVLLRLVELRVRPDRPAIEELIDTRIEIAVREAQLEALRAYRANCLREAAREGTDPELVARVLNVSVRWARELMRNSDA